VDVIVGGGGVIGLSAAVEIAKTGRRVRVLERARPMAEASWAAAGMLAAHDPDLPPELTELASLSLSIYPEYLGEIERLSGHRVPLRTTAAIQIVNHVGITDHALSAEEATARVPGLRTKHRSFLWLEEASLDPRDLCKALPIAARAAGVELLEDTQILSVTPKADLVEVTTRHGDITETLQAGAFINCCGAWAAQVQHSGLERSPAASVEPWKGQMHTVRLDPPLSLHYVLRTPEVYLVPRGDGLVVVGATAERVGFNRDVEATATEWLRVLSADLWPPIASAPLVESWTGLRPGTRDGLPLIGSAGQPHCWIATGHFRNGILLAPATALIVRQMLEGETPSADLASFVPGR
jgi:glycine oxidase